MRNIKIMWNADHERLLFMAAGLSDFEKFWAIENSGALVEYKQISSMSGGRKSIKQTTCIKVSGIRYYIKRSSDKYLRGLVNELNALEIVSRFDITVPKLAAHCICNETSRGIVIYKNLAGYHSLNKLSTGSASPDAIADFQTRKTEIIRDLAKSAIKIQESGYIYNNWEQKHIFIKYKNSGIALVDFANFTELKRRLWFTKAFLKWRDWTKFKSALKSKIYTDKFISQILSGAK